MASACPQSHRNTLLNEQLVGKESFRRLQDNVLLAQPTKRVHDDTLHKPLQSLGAQRGANVTPAKTRHGQGQSHKDPQMTLAHLKKIT